MSRLKYDEFIESAKLPIAQYFILKLLVSQLHNIFLYDPSDTLQHELIYNISGNFIFYNTKLKYQPYLLN
jgi:hypothetical protein